MRDLAGSLAGTVDSVRPRPQARGARAHVLKNVAAKANCQFAPEGGQLFSYGGTGSGIDPTRHFAAICRPPDSSSATLLRLAAWQHSASNSFTDDLPGSASRRMRPYAAFQAALPGLKVVIPYLRSAARSHPHELSAQLAQCDGGTRC